MGISEDTFCKPYPHIYSICLSLLALSKYFRRGHILRVAMQLLTLQITGNHETIYAFPLFLDRGEVQYERKAAYSYRCHLLGYPPWKPQRKHWIYKV